MNILLANDDGINARGIHELADALKGLGDLYISAPDSQRRHEMDSRVREIIDNS